MQRPSNMSLLRFLAAGLLAAVALAGVTAPAMAMTNVPNLTDAAPAQGLSTSAITAIDLAAQPPGGAIQALEMTVHDHALLPDAGADTEFISAAVASPDNQLLRLDGHVFDDWPVFGAQ